MIYNVNVTNMKSSKLAILSCYHIIIIVVIIIIIISTISIIITITIIDFLYLRSPISMILDWVSFLAYPNLFGIKCFVVAAISSIITTLYQPNLYA
jgi:hypothetical protein